MASRFQACSLVASPTHPSSVAWSEENLIAVASGRLVTILNPAFPYGPRGLIKIPEGKPFPIGVIQREDLFSAGLLATCLSRDHHPCVRSISWSHLGLASNAGCLLAVCTTEGRVRLYRPPYCEFSSEWIEVMDISEMLYDYLDRINFGESSVLSSGKSGEQSTEMQPDHVKSELQKSTSRKGQKRKNNTDTCILEGQSPYAGNDMSVIAINDEAICFSEVVEAIPENPKDYDRHQIISTPLTKAKPLRIKPGNDTLPAISADKYTSRNAILSSIVVAWSPMLQLSSSNCPTSSYLSNHFSLLAVGGKSGQISFWRIHEPQYYSIEDSKIPISGVLVGILQAHGKWVTTLSWACFGSGVLDSQLILVSGSSGGSVKIWLGYAQEMTKPSEDNHAPFSLLKEVIAVNSVPITAMSVIVPRCFSHNMLLAVGKGSGSFEVWMCDMSAREFEKVGSYDLHERVVAGLVWAFDGRCLYSCSQDNSVRSWILYEHSLHEVPIPSNISGVKSFTDLPIASDSCFGVAVSPGNLVLAVVRSFDVEFLDPMYQARTQKAAVEFFWIGGQQKMGPASNRHSEIEPAADFSQELLSWEQSIMWSLRQYENPDIPLVIWDVISALLAFKQSEPKFVEYILIKWLSHAFLGCDKRLSIEEILPRATEVLSELSSRRLHLLNVVFRRVILSGHRADGTNVAREIYETENELALWVDMLSLSERELQERLVGLTFSSVLDFTSRPGTDAWGRLPAGLAQMVQWVALNEDSLHDQVRELASAVREVGTSMSQSVNEYNADEQCSYCSASVPFVSPEIALCEGVKESGVVRRHKLMRCAVSMRVCPTTPLWYCMCCQRRVSELPPNALFTLSKYPSGNDSSPQYSIIGVPSKPWCPFCGILLQRLLPDFLLSASPL